MLEREEWSQQSQAYLRRIAEMETECEECAEHLEGEIDRLLNKVSNDMCVCAYVHARVCAYGSACMCASACPCSRTCRLQSLSPAHNSIAADCRQRGGGMGWSGEMETRAPAGGRCAAAT